ncbi:MAG: HK97 gp10 family phage protein [Candidatus Paceibacterota bacterium]
MAGNVGIETVGVAAAISFLNKELKRVEKELNEGVSQATMFLQGEIVKSISGAKSETRSVDTGRFMQSVQSTVNLGVGHVHTNVEYAPFLEYGTSRLSPRRHFWNSLERNRDRINEIIADRLNQKFKASTTGLEAQDYRT